MITCSINHIICSTRNTSHPLFKVFNLFLNDSLNFNNASSTLKTITSKMMLNSLLFTQNIQILEKLSLGWYDDLILDTSDSRLLIIQHKEIELKEIEAQITAVDSDITALHDGGKLSCGRYCSKRLSELKKSSVSRRMNRINAYKKIKSDLINSSILIVELLKDYQNERLEYEKQKTRFDNAMYQNSLNSSVRKAPFANDNDYTLYVEQINDLVLNFKFMLRSYNMLKNQEINQIESQTMDEYKNEYKNLMNDINIFVNMVNKYKGLQIKDKGKINIHDAMSQIRMLHNELKSVVNTIEDNHKCLIDTYSYEPSTTVDDVMPHTDDVDEVVPHTTDDE